MAAAGIQRTATSYRGRPQPHCDERLAQIRIFLADEDYHRTLKFTQRLAEIEEYLRFLEKNNCEFDTKLLKRIKEMIGVHKNWIKRATQAPSTSFKFAQYNHKNRLLGLVKDHKRREQIARVKAPKLPRNLIPGPALHSSMKQNDRPASPDPFLYTKQVAEIRRRQDAEAAQIKKIQERAVLQKRIPVNFNGPYTPLYKLTLEDAMERRSILSETLKRLNQAAKLTPRPFIYELISTITNSARVGEDKALGQSESSLTNDDLRLLLTVAEPSWNSNVRRAMRNLSEDGSPRSAMFAQLMALFNSDFWPDQNSEATLDEVFERFALDMAGEPLIIADVETFILEMNEIGSIRYDANSRIVRRPLLDKHPEDNYPLDSYMIAARRFGNAVAHLDRLLEDGEGSKNMYFSRDTSSIQCIKQRVESKFPLPGLNHAALHSQESALHNDEASALLQKNIILEQHHNWDDRKPDFQNLWAFALSKDTKEQFFSLDRWPPELQNEERKNEIRQSGPEPLSPEGKSREVDFPRPKENETFYPGETIFPFGETPYYEALLGEEIERLRPDAPITRPPYSDPFALPELPESETPALMAHAARLGLGKRKRSLDDDNDDAASGSGPHGAQSALNAEHLTASSDAPPEFVPETIGGVKLRVAESLAGRDRRRVRFNAPGRAEGVGGGVGVRKGLGRQPQLGWFSPRLLRSKEAGRDADADDGSGPSGTTGSANGGAAEQGWVRRPRAASSSATKSSEEFMDSE